MEIIIVIVFGVIALGVLVFGIAGLRKERQTEIDQRLGRYTTNYELLLKDLEQEEEIAKQQTSALTQALDKAIEDRAFAQNWKEQLARADLKITPGEYAASHVLAVGLFFLIGFFIIFQNIILAAVFAVAGFFAPRLYVGFRKGKRLRTFENQLPDTLGMWVNGLKAGFSVMQAMEAIAQEAPDPTSNEFRRVVQEIQLGVPRPEAFEHLLQRMPSDDLDLVVTAVNIQQEVGGNLSEILETISHTIRERIKLKGEVRVLTAQGRITGYVIGGLPVVLALFLYTVNREYMGRLIENRGCGWPLLCCGIGLISLGTAAIQKIVDIEI
jgi:tight adherence protein B